MFKGPNAFTESMVRYAHDKSLQPWRNILILAKF